MKKLYIVRHAKAELYTWGKKDFDRNIVEKGKERAEVIAEKLKQQVTITEKTAVLSSSANRAIQTAQIFCNILDFPMENIQQNINIYEAHYLDILRAINTIPAEMENLLVFGHNPGLSDLTNYLCNSFVDLKTSQVAIIELEENINFENLSGGTGTLVGLITE